MRHKKILLGAVATVMGAGLALAPAKAADVNGLVTTMVDYVASCGNGAGVTFNNTCVTISGTITFSVGHGGTINYGGDADLGDGIPAGFYCDTQYNGGAPDLTLVCGEGEGDNWHVGTPATPNADFGTPAGNTVTFNNGEMGVSFTPKLSFAWQSGGYDVKIAFPLTDPSSVEVDISRPGGIAIHLERHGLSGNSVVVSMPFNAFKVTLGADFDGGDPDLDLGVTGAFGDVTVGFGVHSDDWSDPTFDADLGFSFGDWKLSLHGATRGWGAGSWNPEVDALIAGGFGAFKVSVFAGWVDLATDAYAVGAQVSADLAGNAVAVGFLHARGEADWDYFTDDYGTFPYTLAAGENFNAMWAGITRDWNSEHSTRLRVFFSASPDIADSDNLRIEARHTWKPVGGAVTVTGTAWAQQDFGGAVGGWVFGAGLTASLALIR